MAGPASRCLHVESGAGCVTLRYLRLWRRAVQTGTLKAAQPPSHVPGPRPPGCVCSSHLERELCPPWLVKATVSLSGCIVSATCPFRPGGTGQREHGVLRPNSEEGDLAMRLVRAQRGEATWLTVTTVDSSVFPMQDQLPGSPPATVPLLRL